MLQRTCITTGERTRTSMFVAFVLSIAVNALCVLVFPRMHASRPIEPAAQPIEIRPVVIATLPPPPPVRHIVRPRVRVVSAMPPSVPKRFTLAPGRSRRAPFTAKRGIAGFRQTTGTTGEGTLVAPPAPVVDVTAAPPSCATPNAEATVQNVVSPEYPDSARALQLGEVDVLVVVTLDARGALESLALQQSSGNAAIDAAALRSARQSTYAPKIVNCVPVSGAYIFRATFTP